MTPEDKAELEQRRALKAQQAPEAQQQAQAQQAPQSSQGLLQGGLEQFGQGTSLGFGDEISSAIMSPFLGMEGEGLGDTYSRLQEQNRARMEGFRETNPKTAMAANLAGNVVTGIASGGLGGNMIAREAALGGLEGVGSAEEGERIESGLWGAGMGAGFSKLGDVIGSVFSRPSASQRIVDGISEVAERAEKRAGKKLLTRAQLTGSDMAKRVEAGLETLPVAGGATKRVKEGFQQTLNREAAASIGMQADSLTDDVINAASDNISQLYKRATAQGDIAVSPDNITRLASIVDNVKKLPSRPDTAVRVGDNLIDELMDGSMTSSRYNELSQDIRGSLFKAQKAGDSPNMKALGEISDQLDDMVESTLGGESLAAFKEARNLYRNLKVLTKGTNTITAEGNVSGKLLFNELAKGGKASRVAGTPLGDLAKLSKIPGVGDSGTASRLIPGMAIGAGVMGGADVSGGLLAGIGGARLLDEVAQQGVPGMTREGVGMLGGAYSRSRE